MVGLERVYGKFDFKSTNSFDNALKYAPVDFWTADGVHPKAPGHELIKREWIKAFNEIK